MPTLMRPTLLRCTLIAATWGGHLLAQTQGQQASLATRFLTIPALNTAPVVPANRSFSAAEAAYYVRGKDAQVRAALSFRDAHYPADSLLQVVAQTGAEWLARLQTRPITGIQHDAAAQVGVVAGQEEYAKAQIAERLATSGLRLTDRAFTLTTAVEAFADPHYPKRFPTAEAYLAQLDALGDEAALWQFEARSTLLQAYYMVGQSANVARHGVRALERLTVIPYIEQPRFELVYLYTVEALSGQRDGRSQIEKLNQMIRSTYYTPPPAVLALDSTYAEVGRGRRAWMEKHIGIAALLGTQGQPLVSNYWVNRPTTDSAIVPVNDGKIRLLEIFSYGCDGCVMALHGLQRIQQQLPGHVEAMATTYTFGYWANRLVTPDEEAQRLHDYFVKQIKVTFPVAIWKWRKVQQENGGEPPEGHWETPIGRQYPVIGKPTIYVLDGHGRIRRIFVGGDRETEAQMLQTVEFLLHEAATTATTPSPQDPLQKTGA